MGRRPRRVRWATAPPERPPPRVKDLLLQEQEVLAKVGNRTYFVVVS